MSNMPHPYAICCLAILLILFSLSNATFILHYSFAKNFGLYGERAGAVMVVGSSKEEADKITSQLKILIRPMYSSPPTHGAQIIVEIMSDEQLFEQWRQECKGMATRIHDMRSMLRGELERLAKVSCGVLFPEYVFVDG